MALTKTIEDDKLEVVGTHKDLQIRTATVIKEDGTELSRSFHRRVLHCVSSEKNADNCHLSNKYQYRFPPFSITPNLIISPHERQSEKSDNNSRVEPYESWIKKQQR